MKNLKHVKLENLITNLQEALLTHGIINNDEMIKYEMNINIE